MLTIPVRLLMQQDNFSKDNTHCDLDSHVVYLIAFSSVSPAGLRFAVTVPVTISLGEHEVDG